MFSVDHWLSFGSVNAQIALKREKEEIYFLFLKNQGVLP
jgi:hypothetical protein